MAEAAHSVADTLNEVFLLLSLRKADRPADRTHPFGYGKERFFWSLLAAVGIFVSGAGYSAYQGVGAARSGRAAEHAAVRHRLRRPGRPPRPGGAVPAEGAGPGPPRGGTARRSPLAFVRASPDPTVKTVASEDTVAVLGVRGGAGRDGAAPADRRRAAGRGRLPGHRGPARVRRGRPGPRHQGAAHRRGGRPVGAAGGVRRAGLATGGPRGSNSSSPCSSGRRGSWSPPGWGSPTTSPPRGCATVCPRSSRRCAPPDPDVDQVFLDSGATREDAGPLRPAGGDGRGGPPWLDGDAGVPAAFRSRTVRRAAGSAKG